MSVREKTEAWEDQFLSPHAVPARRTQGRVRPEPPCAVRTEFQRDADRIVHSKAFRRLMHKTQVFLLPEGDHYRTRMTHTLEVMRIASTLARALSLNEDLTAAIALGHDLGHTPFGHAGEYALQDVCPFGFSHNAQSLRVVDNLERNGVGLNLTAEVRDGILCHSGDMPARTWEGQLVHKADRIAYLNHDLDDAFRAGILREEDFPSRLRAALGQTNSDRINAMVCDLIEHTHVTGAVSYSPDMEQIASELRVFLFDNVYRNPIAKGEEQKAADIVKKLYTYYTAHPHMLPADMQTAAQQEPLARVVCDYVAGMTDRYAVSRFADLFVPKGWEKY